MKELVHAAGYFGADVFQVLKVFRRIACQIVQVCHRCSKYFGGRLSYIADTQPENEPVQRLVPRRLNGCLKIAHTLLPESLQLTDLIKRQAIDTRDVLHKPKFIELADVCLTQTADIHGIFAGPMNDPLYYLSRTVDIDTT